MRWCSPLLQRSVQHSHPVSSTSNAGERTTIRFSSVLPSFPLSPFLLHGEKEQRVGCSLSWWVGGGNQARCGKRQGGGIDVSRSARQCLTLPFSILTSLSGCPDTVLVQLMRIVSGEHPSEDLLHLFYTCELHEQEHPGAESDVAICCTLCKQVVWPVQKWESSTVLFSRTLRHSSECKPKAGPTVRRANGSAQGMIWNRCQPAARKDPLARAESGKTALG